MKKEEDNEEDDIENEEFKMRKQRWQVSLFEMKRLKSNHVSFNMI